MTTKLVGTTKREVLIDGVAHTVTLTPQGVSIKVKRYRKALNTVSWKDLREVVVTRPPLTYGIT